MCFLNPNEESPDGLCVFPQCPLNRTAPEEEGDCSNCALGPPGQRGPPGRMVTHAHVHTQAHTYTLDYP